MAEKCTKSDLQHSRTRVADEQCGEIWETVDAVFDLRRVMVFVDLRESVKERLRQGRQKSSCLQKT